jgi:peptide/nickel transport system ATP-binding protein
MSIFCSLRQLSVTYGRGSSGAAALDHIDLDIASGERLAIIGESGSGKSTLARALAGLLPEGAKVQGELLWPALGHPPRPGRDFGLVFQDPGSSLNPVLTIGEQIAEGARRHLGLSWKQAYIRAEELLGRVRIPQPDKAMRAFPHQLSGGQRQRALAGTAFADDRQALAGNNIKTDPFQRHHLATIAPIAHRQVADRKQRRHDRLLRTAVVSTTPSPAR